MEPLGVDSHILVFVQLLCPVYRLRGNEMASGSYEIDYAIRCLDLIHVIGVPSHLWFKSDTSVSTGYSPSTCSWDEYEWGIGCVLCCSVREMRVFMGRCEVVHTFSPSSDCYVPRQS